jgi:hypothetical protein
MLCQKRHGRHLTTKNFTIYSIGFAFIEKFRYRHADSAPWAQGQVFYWKIDDLSVTAARADDFDRFLF